MDDGRSMRAAKDSLAVPPDGEAGKIGRPSLGLMARLGDSIAKQSEGRAGEKNLPVGGRVRTLRAVRDSSGSSWGQRTRASREQVTECASLRRLSWHPFHGGPSGSLLEFLQSRLYHP